MVYLNPLIGISFETHGVTFLLENNNEVSLIQFIWLTQDSFEKLH